MSDELVGALALFAAALFGALAGYGLCAWQSRRRRNDVDGKQ